MNQTLDTPRIGGAELQKLVADVDPTALLVPSRLLRRIIKEDCHIGGVGLQVPHRKTYTISRDDLLAIADRDDLGLSETRELPDRLILLACPESWLAARSREDALLRFWRLLFHARIDQALEEQYLDGRLTDAHIRAMIHRIGPVEYEEVFRVLRHEDFLLPPADLHVCFTEFVALFFELRYFARPMLPRYFPAMENPDRVASILKEVLDADHLFQATRLAGAADPVSHLADLEDEPPAEPEDLLPPSTGMPNAAKCGKLLGKAEAAGARGNLVRSAILRLHAADIAPPDQIDVARKGALADLERLVTRLQAALELHDREAEEWRAALPALLGPASRGIWPPSARLLYDLQKVCVDYERDLYALDMVEWVCSLGRKPIQREVPLQADVLLVKHLRSAARRLSKTRISDEDRRRLGILLRAAVHHCEKRLREKIRPILIESLQQVGFDPENRAEELALKIIVEELLDRVAERGFLNMGDIRDAISRNQLKLPDASVRDLLLGDRLLKANRQLALSLDGVYHRGEIYLRWLQRFSSLLFGTILGRWLTLYLILPVGGAFAILVFWQEMVHLSHVAVEMVTGKNSVTVRQATTLVADLANPSGYAPIISSANLSTPRPKQHHPPSLIALGIWSVFLFLLIHAPPFRQRVALEMNWLWKGLRRVFIDVPVALFHLPAVRRFLDSRSMVLFRRRIVMPILLGLIAAIFCMILGIPGPFDDVLAFLFTFLAAFAFLSSRFGRRTEELVTDWFGRNWYWLRVEALGGFIALIIWFFREVIDRIERVLYTVDEWLRFRPGDNRIALFYKPVLGLFWFFLTYFIRVIINLMIEPTINPVKHFPAVTVGAKLIIPMIPAWGLAMTEVMKPFLGVALAGTIAGALIILIPGVFGFAAWELKENWKLYRANRPRNLIPVMIGHHGETMLRFMKPGFHSGTLPKLFAKLRKAERHHDGRKIHKHHENLHHVAESIRHFVERELLLLLEQSRSWGSLVLHVGEVKPATNRVRIELRCPTLDESGCWLAFEERAGWLTAGIYKPGWLEKLRPEAMSAFRTALAGLYKLAGVHLIREQIEACLPVPMPYIVDGRGLVVYPKGDFTTEVVHPLGTAPVASPLAEAEPTISRDQLLYPNVPITWNEWVNAWEADKQGQTPDLVVMQQVRLLPMRET